MNMKPSATAGFIYRVVMPLFVSSCLFSSLAEARKIVSASECESLSNDLLAEGSRIPSKKKINIYVLIAKDERLRALHGASTEVQQGRDLRRYPDERSYFLAPKSISELKTMLAALPKDKLVHRLFINAHGANLDGEVVIGGFEIGPRVLFQRDFYSDAFSEIAGRFTPDALILFESCKTESQKNTAQAFENLARAFHLGSGRIFLSSEYVFNWRDQVMHQSAFDQSRIDNSIGILIAQLLAPLTYPAFYLADHIFGHGTLYTHTTKGNCFKKLHLFDAQCVR